MHLKARISRRLTTGALVRGELPRLTSVSPNGEPPYSATSQSPVKTRLFPASQHIFPNFRRLREPQAPKSHGGPSARGTIHARSARTAQAHL
jgi:hypothetical protein